MNAGEVFAEVPASIGSGFDAAGKVGLATLGGSVGAGAVIVAGSAAGSATAVGIGAAAAAAIPVAGGFIAIGVGIVAGIAAFFDAIFGSGPSDRELALAKMRFRIVMDQKKVSILRDLMLGRRSAWVPVFEAGALNTILAQRMLTAAEWKWILAAFEEDDRERSNVVLDDAADVTPWSYETLASAADATADRMVRRPDIDSLLRDGTVRYITRTLSAKQRSAVEFLRGAAKTLRLRIAVLKKHGWTGRGAIPASIYASVAREQLDAIQSAGLLRMEVASRAAVADLRAKRELQAKREMAANAAGVPWGAIAIGIGSVAAVAVVRHRRERAA